MESKLSNIRITPTVIYHSVVSFFKKKSMQKFNDYFLSTYEELNFRYPRLTIIQLSGFGSFYRSFENGEISYQELLKELKSLGINITDSIVFKEISLKNEEEKEAYRKRKENEDYLPTDILGICYQVPKTRETRLLLGNDSYITRLLAELGDERATKEVNEDYYLEKNKLKQK